MKKIPFYLVLFIFSFMYTVSSCSSDENTSSTPPVVDVTPIVNGMMQGSWRVTFYEDHTEDETDHFTGYNFTFGSGNVLTASNGTVTNTGSWNVTNSTTGDDSPSDNVDVNIYFASPIYFADITDDWDIVSRTATKIELIDVSGGSVNTDYLTLEKN